MGATTPVGASDGSTAPGWTSARWTPGYSPADEDRPRASGARFVGDAAPVAGIPLSRIGNGLCYLLTGVALVVGGASGGTSMLWGPLLGLFCAGYGVRILLTRGTYWISSVIYVGALFAVGYAYSTLIR